MGLTPLALRFLEARANVSSDNAAAKIAGVGPSAVTRWKKNPEFLAKYNELLSLQPDHNAAVLVKALVENKARVLVREWERVLTGPVGTAKMQAIRLGFEVLGLVGDNKTPAVTLSDNLKGVVAVMANVYVQAVKADAQAQSVHRLLEGKAALLEADTGEDEESGEEEYYVG